MLANDQVGYVLSGRTLKPEEPAYASIVLGSGFSFFLSHNEITVRADELAEIVITSWDNTDYARAEIVHVINEDGSRNLNSRIPILYYKDNSNEELINSIVESLQK